MIVINRHRANVIKTRHGSEIRPLVDRTTSAITQCSLAEELLLPGQAVTPHRHHEIEEIYYVVEGRGMMTVGDERQEVVAGDGIFLAHGQRPTPGNTRNEPDKVLLAFGPAFFF